VSLGELLMKKMKCRPGSEHKQPEVLPTGVPPIDHGLVGGFAYGRFHELYGSSRTGKTMLVFLLLANNQRVGGLSVLIETEGTFDPEFYRACGGDPDTLVLVPFEHCHSVESVFNFVNKAAKEAAEMSNEQKVVIGWDGIAATPTAHLLDVGMDKRDMSKALAISQGLSLITQRLAQTNIMVLATNQTREVVGSMDSTIHSPGGKALEFYSTQRICLLQDGGGKSSEIREESEGKEDRFVLGYKVKGVVTKSKLGKGGIRFGFPIYCHAGRKHPVYDGVTFAGIDADEALFNYYLTGPFLVAGKRVVYSEKKGWYTLNPAIVTDAKNFRQGEWPEMLDKYPQLWVLLYADNEVPASAIPSRVPRSQRRVFECQLSISLATPPDPPGDDEGSDGDDAA
jgi:RecA/RadA recombinase